MGITYQVHIFHRLFNHRSSQRFLDAFERSINIKMLLNSEPLENRVKLRTVSYLLSGDVEALDGCNVLSMDVNCALRWVDLASHRLEACCFSSPTDSQKRKAFAVL